MVSILKKAQQRVINEAISRAELSSDGEIVVVIAEQSGDYRAVSLVISIVISTVITLLIWKFAEIYVFPILCLIQMGLLAAADTLLQETGWVVQLIPTSIKLKAASRNAKAQFVQSRLHTTRRRAAILIFLSKRERYIELIPDIGIADRVDSDTWENLAKHFSDTSKSNPLEASLVSLIEKCGALLNKHFPASSENPNELPNSIEIQ